MNSVTSPTGRKTASSQIQSRVRDIQEATRGVTAQYPRSYILQCIKEDRFPEELWQALGKFGLLGLSIPEEYGGSGGGVLEITALNEALALAGVPTLFLVVTGLARVPIVRNGTRPLASAELYVIIDLPKKSTGTPANVPMRGVGPEAAEVRQEFSLVEGRMFEFGTNEVIVGRAASGQFVSTNVGDTIVSGQNRWQVVGIFEADGGVAETEIWCDARVLQGAYRRGNTYQSLLAQLDSSGSFDAFRDSLTSNPQVNVSIRRENEYYAWLLLLNTCMFGIFLSFGLLIGIAVGGIATLSGAIYGAIFLQVIFVVVGAGAQALQTWNLHLLYGLVLIVFLAFNPRGVAGLIDRTWVSMRRRW